ncbi:tRNA lysidine(34) synthetase TilS [Adlercreutzia sp. ZJ154]|uniref:tRNA lysidine(34) synthetase TilS n=1 Tax=Adlercreutzia sp. ZJ154 TaxID=2709790 RepID=UPI0013EDE250|nr:tRNA lysidine(34) synthetase TilS [Adlercreutzia sp. ZJ154]
MNNELMHTMCSTAEKYGLFCADSAVLLMVSGGSDSTALAYLMAAARAAGKVGPVAMLHVNHKLRGCASDEDAEFVSGLAALLDIPLFVCEVDVAGEAARSGDNVEAVARRERYAAANEALSSMCLHECVPLSEGRIVTAHTADDRIENFYMRSIVGTGPGGFRSMKRKNGPVVRPLLNCTREQLRDYICARKNAGLDVMEDAAGALWREDATNAHTDRFRAYVRHKIVPQAKEWSAGMPQTLTRTMDLIADEDDMLDAMADEIIAERVDMVEGGAFFKLLPVFGEVRMPLQRRVVVKLLKRLLGADERIDTASVDAVLAAFSDGKPKSGYVANIQGNLAISSNKRGVLVEPMAEYRRRRKGLLAT